MPDVSTVSFDYASTGSVQAISGASFTMSRGIRPSQGELTCIPQTITDPVGDLTLSIAYGAGGSTTIVLTDCLIDQGSIEIVGPQVMRLSFYDRRWRWENGHIDGLYNIQQDDSSYKRERTTAQLMALCLDAMSETNYQLGLVTDDARLSVDWRGDNPALALNEIMVKLGYTLAFNAMDQVVIYPIGTGFALPSTGREGTISFGVNRGVLPATIRIACSNVRYECKFLLEAVGEDTDGEIKAIDDLSYAPAGGWTAASFPDFTDITGTYTVDGKATPTRNLARQWIFRAYRIKQQAHTAANWAPPGFAGTAAEIDEREYILPLRPHLNSETSDNGDKRPKPAIVEGVFYKQDDRSANTEEFTRYDKPFSIDTKRGIVKFSDRVYKLAGNANEEITEPDLYLKCVVEVDDQATGQKQYYGYDKATGASGAFGVKTLDHPEILYKVTPTYDGATFTPSASEPLNPSTNQTFVDDEADYYASAEIELLTPEESFTIEWGDLLALELDGMRNSVRWQVGYQSPPTTVASIGTEVNPYEPSYEEFTQQALRDFMDGKVNRLNAFSFEGDPSTTQAVQE